MKPYLSLVFAVLAFPNIHADPPASPEPGQPQPIDCASPMSGTGGTGHTFPGALTLPHAAALGMGR